MGTPGSAARRAARRLARKRCELDTAKTPIDNPVPANYRLTAGGATYLAQNCKIHGPDCPSTRLWLRKSDGTEVRQDRLEQPATATGTAEPAVRGWFRGRCKLADTKTPVPSPVPNPDPRLAQRSTGYLTQDCLRHGPNCPSTRLWLRKPDGTEVLQDQRTR